MKSRIGHHYLFYRPRENAFKNLAKSFSNASPSTNQTPSALFDARADGLSTNRDHDVETENRSTFQNVRECKIYFANNFAHITDF